MGPPNNVKTPDLPTPHSNFHFADGNIVICVGNVLFKLHRSMLCRDPQSAFSEYKEASTEPFKVDSRVSALAFESLVRVVYCMQFATKLEPGILPKKQWLGALQLATRFNLPSVLSFILASTSATYIPSTELADYLSITSSIDIDTSVDSHTSRSHDILSLAHDIMNALKARKGKLDEREIDVLGPALAAAVARAREEHRVREWGPMTPNMSESLPLQPLPPAHLKKASEGPIAHHPKYYFPDGNLVILVENTLFNLHRSFLCRDTSSVFASMFAIPTSATDKVEGLSDEVPVVIPEVSAHAFADLVTAMYNSAFNTVLDPKTLSVSRWVSVLHLADKFCLDSVTKIIISSVKVTPLFNPSTSISSHSDGNGGGGASTTMSLSNGGNPGYLAHILAIMVSRARLFSARTREEVFHDLCCRNSYLTQEEVASLGSELTALVLECREELLSTAQRPPGSPAIDTSQIAKTYSDKITLS